MPAAPEKCGDTKKNKAINVIGRELDHAAFAAHLAAFAAAAAPDDPASFELHSVEPLNTRGWKKSQRAKYPADVKIEVANSFEVHYRATATGQKSRTAGKLANERVLQHMELLRVELAKDNVPFVVELKGGLTHMPQQRAAKRMRVAGDTEEGTTEEGTMEVDGRPPLVENVMIYMKTEILTVKDTVMEIFGEQHYFASFYRWLRASW